MSRFSACVYAYNVRETSGWSRCTQDALCTFPSPATTTASRSFEAFSLATEMVKLRRKSECAEHREVVGLPAVTEACAEQAINSRVRNVYMRLRLLIDRPLRTLWLCWEKLTRARTVG